MKVLGINGSARREANTNFFLNHALQTLEEKGIETDYVWLGDKELKPCTACYKCTQEKRCVIEDDFDPIFEKMLDADGLILASPSYHAAMSAFMKALLDRAGFVARWITNDINEIKSNGKYHWNKNGFSGKVAAPISVSRRTGQVFTVAELLVWFSVNDFYIVSSDYWNVGAAGTGGSINASDDEEGVGIMGHMADNMAHLLKKLNS